MKKIIIIIIGLLIIGAGWFVFSKNNNKTESTSSGPLDTSYNVAGESIKLINGKAEKDAAPGSASKIKTSVFGEPVYGDVNNDGTKDAILYLTQDTGGSGTFYYAAVALNKNGSYVGTNAVILGDRIAPQTVEYKNGLAVFNYAIRKSTDPMTTAPSIGFSKYLTVTDDVLVENKASGNVTLSVGGAENIQSLQIKLNSVSENSICASDVVCIQAGRLVASVTLTEGENTMTKNISSDSYLQFGSYKVTITDIQPVKISTKTIKDSDYRITFKVE